MKEFECRHCGKTFFCSEPPHGCPTSTVNAEKKRKYKLKKLKRKAQRVKKSTSAAVWAFILQHPEDI